MTRHRVVLTKRAEQQIERVDAWWRTQRVDARGGPLEELEELIERL